MHPLIFITVIWACLGEAVIPFPQGTNPPLPPQNPSRDENPEGYYSFLQAPHASPPQVRAPPYFKSAMPCPGVKSPVSVGKSLKNLCGDLNRGYIPENPMHQNVLGAPYPFELIKNKTLRFFSHTLPILQSDETIPKVTKYQESSFQHRSYTNKSERRSHQKREISSDIQDSLSFLNSMLTGNNTNRNARKFCETGDGMLCMLYRAIQGKPIESTAIERREDIIPEYRRSETNLDGPPTPCPARVEYSTPVFARNYQGIWRYVVQIPYEGYFTQTIEITKCLGTKCHYMEGGCLSSPRWVSLLVAEIYYPDDSSIDARNISNTPRSPVQGVEPPYPKLQPFQKRSGHAQNSNHCDGHDQNGCFQVRLYYDWFLVPGSCKCWRSDYLHRFIH